MRCLQLGLALSVAACGSSTPPPATVPPSASSAADAAPAADSAPAASSATTPPPVPTGGSVLIGEINAPKAFNPRPAVEAMSAELTSCYNKARAGKPELRGKLTLQINLSEAGAVLSVDAAPGGHANDPALVACIEGAMKAGAHFPKPGGMATVTAPLVFRP